MHNTIRARHAAIACLSALLLAGCGQPTTAAAAASDPDASNTADVAIAGTDAEVAAADVAQSDLAETAPDVDSAVATDAAESDALLPDVLPADTATPDVDTASPDGDAADSGTVDVDTADTAAPDVAPGTDAAAVCVPQDCDDGNPCTLDACNAANACVHSAKPDGASCSDGNACTSGDACTGGKCVGALAVKCAGNACTVDACDPKTGKCVALADGSTCTDGSQCTAFDACAAGACVGQPIDVSAACDDGNLCTIDGCDVVKGCTHTNSKTCSDDNPCTSGDTCSGGVCAGVKATNCDDGNACTADSCNASTGCVNTAIGGSCDDGDACTTADACAAGACKGVVGYCGNGVCCGENPMTCPVDCGNEATLVTLPAGTFAMGSPAGIGDNHEHPQHQVTLSAFQLDKTEVTVAQYTAFYGQLSAGQKCNGQNSGSFSCGQPDTSTPANPTCNWTVAGKEQHPINCVDWYQASAYCAWAHTGGRLPTEAEREYAAKSGGQNQTYPWGNAAPTCSLAIFSGCTSASTAATCSAPAGNSSQGACDLAGNVEEWCADWFGDYSAAAQTDPIVATQSAWGDVRVVRDSAWYYVSTGLYAAHRGSGDPASRNWAVGFRCAKTL